jgi:carbamate kinase
VVPSPLPERIVEESAVKQLIADGIVVIAVGGGGIPVVAGKNGDLRGVSAVIDKDYASALLASNIGAELLMISTAVEKVALNFGQPDQRWIDRLTVAEARQYLAEGTHFAKGSMAPKIQAAINYLEAGGGKVVITDPPNIERALAGETGTFIVR